MLRAKRRHVNRPELQLAPIESWRLQKRIEVGPNGLPALPQLTILRECRRGPRVDESSQGRSVPGIVRRHIGATDTINFLREAPAHSSSTSRIRGCASAERPMTKESRHPD